GPCATRRHGYFSYKQRPAVVDISLISHRTKLATPKSRAICKTLLLFVRSIRPTFSSRYPPGSNLLPVPPQPSPGPIGWATIAQVEIQVRAGCNVWPVRTASMYAVRGTGARCRG